MKAQLADNTVASLLVMIIVLLLGIMIGATLMKLEENLDKPIKKEINYKQQMAWINNSK